MQTLKQKADMRTIRKIEKHSVKNQKLNYDRKIAAEKKKKREVIAKQNEDKIKNLVFIPGPVVKSSPKAKTTFNNNDSKNLTIENVGSNLNIRESIEKIIKDGL